MSEARDVLMRTKRLFTSGRWTQGTMCKTTVVNDQAQEVFCLVGGLREVSRGKLGYTEAGLAIARTLSRNPNPSSFERSLIMFNDRGDTTVDKVVELIDEAIADIDAAPAPL